MRSYSEEKGMEEKSSTILLFNYYRDAELRSADLTLRLINKAENLNIQEKLARHLADATNHAWLWTERIGALGGQPTRINTGYHRLLRRKVGLPANLLELLTLMCVVEERARKRYEEHAARSDIAPETLEILNEMRADEEAHLAWITEKLTELGAKEGQEKVTAELQRYRVIEATVFADMQQEEQRALAEVVQGTTAS